jgi:ABC-2 type transport system ATP-binding protein
MSNSRAALEINGLSHNYGTRRALHNVSLLVPEGSFTMLLGLNGAGKTTLFSQVTGLYHNRTGTIRVCGYDPRRKPSAALSRLGVVFQARTLDLDLTVAQNLLYQAALHGIPGGEARRRTQDLLTQVGLAERARDKIRMLSGGQMRRVEIIRALLHRPALLLLDEPTVGLDIESRVSLLAEVRRRMREEGLGVLWATHLIDEVENSDRVVVLHKGHILAAGILADLLSPDDATTEAFFRRLVATADRTETAVERAA